MSELTGLKNATIEIIKRYVSSTQDRYRVAYGKRTENFPRQCIFFGTTNSRDFLRDPTGNRRFWPLDVHDNKPSKSIFKEFGEGERAQIWAEVKHLHDKGEPLYLSKEIEALAFKAQEEHRETNEHVGIIQNYLDTLLPINWDELSLYERRAYLQGDALQSAGLVQRDRVCAAEIWCEALQSNQKDITPYGSRGIHDIMRNMAGWQSYKSKTSFKGYGNQKGYHRIPAGTPLLSKKTPLLNGKNSLTKKAGTPQTPL
jgi:putative DNA primase/helicase